MVISRLFGQSGMARKGVLWATVLAVFCTSCAPLSKEMSSTSAVETQTGNDDTFRDMDVEPEFGYAVPMSSPHILIDELGYLPDSTKTVFFYGDELPEHYTVRDAETDAVVFEGETEDRGYSELYQSAVAYGDFSELTGEGLYYIEAQLLGRSYSFEIRGNLYDELFREACKTYYYNRCGMTLTTEFAGENAHNACHTAEAVLRQDMTSLLDVSGGWHQDGSGSRDVVRAATAMSNLLLSYELFSAAFSDDVQIPESGNGVPDILDEARYEAEWLRKLQNPTSGEVYAAVTVFEPVIYVEDATAEAAYAFAAVLSKFSFLYQDFDRDYATQCLRAADRAWEYAERNYPPLDGGVTAVSPWKLFAAAEIYRASAHRGCETFLNAYFASLPSSPEDMDEIVFYGCVTYLNTKQRVNTSYCESIIKIIMKEAEEISAESRNSVFLVPGDKEQGNNALLLKKMVTMTLVDHIITNHEYDTIIENYLHYFLGRNAMSVVYLDNVGTYGYRELSGSFGIMKQFEADSMLIFMLSRIISKDGFIG